MRRLVSLLVTCLASCLLISCGNTDTTVNTAPGNNPFADSTMDRFDIPLPQEFGPGRDVSALTNWELLGVQAFPREGVFTLDGTSLNISAAPGALSYAVYELFGGAYDFDTIYFDIRDVINPDALWFGVSDYGANRWRWMQLGFGQTSIDISGLTAKGDGGAAYLAVVEWDDGSSRVNKVWIELDKPVWIKEPVSLEVGLGLVNGMAIVDGHPCIAAIDVVAPNDYDFYYINSNQNWPSFGDWDISEIAAGYTETLKTVELIEHGSLGPGLAAIFDDGELWYAYSSAVIPVVPAEWDWAAIGIARDNELGLAMIDGIPAVLFNSTSIHGGDALLYARSNIADPTSLSWEYFTVAETTDATQNYEGLSLAAIQQQWPTMQYWDHTGFTHYFAASNLALPVLPIDLTTTAVHTPPLGGSQSATVDWQGTAALFYDTVNNVNPRFAYTTHQLPDTPERFEAHHKILRRGAEEFVAAANTLWVGAAWRDLETGGVMFARYEDGPAVPTGGAAWKVALVDERFTDGEIGLVSLLGGIPGICYHVTGDGLLYFARMVPTT